MKQHPNKPRPAYAPPVSLPVKGSPPDLEKVAVKAYEHWEKDGRPLGTPPADERPEEREMLRDSAIQADTFRRKARRTNAEATPGSTPPSAEETPPVETPSPSTASNHEIALRAYQLWAEDGHIEGRALDYWLQAEREINERPKPSPTLDLPASHPAPGANSTVDRHDLQDERH